MSSVFCNNNVRMPYEEKQQEFQNKYNFLLLSIAEVARLKNDWKISIFMTVKVCNTFSSLTA